MGFLGVGLLLACPPGKPSSKLDLVENGNRKWWAPDQKRDG